MKNSIPSKIALLFFTFLNVLTVAAQNSIELKYNLNINDSYSYITETNQAIEMNVDEQVIKMDMVVTMDMIYTILSQNNEDITIDGEIKRIKMSQSSFGMNLEYDSETPADDNPMTVELDKQFQNILNKTFKIKMDFQGKLTNIDLSNIQENDELSKSFNSGTSFAIYPKGNIKIGQTWSEDIVPNEKSDMKFSVTYTLLKLSNTQATIGIESTITANKVEDADVNMTGTMNGEMIIDAKSGWLIESLINQKITMDIVESGMKFPATISGTIKSTSTKL